MTSINNKDAIETGGSRIKFWGGAVIVLMIILMFMPWNIGQRTRDDHHSTVIGSASDGRKIYSGEVLQAERDLELLQSLYVYIQRDPNNLTEPPYVPLLTALWGVDRVNELKRNNWAYYLLVQESRKFGLGENVNTIGSLERDEQNPRADGVFNSGFVPIRDLHPLFGSELYAAMHGGFGPRQNATKIVRIAYQNETSLSPDERLVSTLAPIEQQAIYRALRDLLAVQAASSLADSAVKPSPLLVDQLIARSAQSFTLNVASVDARPFIDSVSVPSDADLKAQLDKFANLPADQVTPENPFGFGYQVPNAVKFQMISFSREDVRKVVEAEKTAYDWEVDARMAYARDPSPFKALAPATQPTSQPSTAPATDLNTAEPFDNIKAGAVRLMVDKATATRVDDIIRKIRSTISLDHQGWLTSQPSSLGVSYDSLDYLNRLAASVQVEPRFKVLPSVSSEQSRFLGEEQLTLHPVVSRLVYRFQPATARQLGIRVPMAPASQYMVMFAKPFLDKKIAEQAGSAVLEPFKPSDPLTDFTDDTVAFIRLTETKAAHAATDIEPVRMRLVADVNRSKAQAKAIEKANAAIESIKATGKFEVAGANMSTVTIDPEGTAPPELGLTGNAYLQFRQEVGRNLLGEPGGQPLAALNVPLADKVFVAQRTGLRSFWGNEEELNVSRMVTAAQLTQRMQAPKSPMNTFGLTDAPIGDDWLSVEAIRKRNAYVSTGGRDDEESDVPPATQPEAK